MYLSDWFCRAGLISVLVYSADDGRSNFDVQSLVIIRYVIAHIFTVV